MAEELLEINENDEVTSIEEPVEAPAEENIQREEFNPFFAYLQGVFSKEKSDEFINSLDDEQKRFVLNFVLGFQTAIGCNIVGIYDYEYIEGFHFTAELLQSVNVILKPVEVTDMNMKFVLVAQY